MKDLKLIQEAKTILLSTLNMLNHLNYDDYTTKIHLLGDSSIGEHTRHIIELFQQLMEGYEHGEVDYDKRKRNPEIQQNIDCAIESLADIISSLEKQNKEIRLSGAVLGEELDIRSCYHRELLYNIEHCVHHQAIIKIGLLFLEKDIVCEGFGVAESTKIYKKSCAQ